MKLILIHYFVLYFIIYPINLSYAADDYLIAEVQGDYSSSSMIDGLGEVVDGQNSSDEINNDDVNSNQEESSTPSLNEIVDNVIDQDDNDMAACLKKDLVKDSAKCCFDTFNGEEKEDLKLQCYNSVCSFKEEERRIGCIDKLNMWIKNNDININTADLATATVAIGLTISAINLIMWTIGDFLFGFDSRKPNPKPCPAVSMHAIAIGLLLGAIGTVIVFLMNLFGAQRIYTDYFTRTQKWKDQADKEGDISDKGYIANLQVVAIKAMIEEEKVKREILTVKSSFSLIQAIFFTAAVVLAALEAKDLDGLIPGGPKSCPVPIKKLKPQNPAAGGTRFPGQGWQSVNKGAGIKPIFGGPQAKLFSTAFRSGIFPSALAATVAIRSRPVNDSDGVDDETDRSKEKNLNIMAGAFRLIQVGFLLMHIIRLFNDIFIKHPNYGKAMAKNWDEASKFTKAFFHPITRAVVAGILGAMSYTLSGLLIRRVVLTDKRILALEELLRKLQSIKGGVHFFKLENLIQGSNEVDIMDTSNSSDTEIDGTQNLDNENIDLYEDLDNFSTLNTKKSDFPIKKWLGKIFSYLVGPLSAQVSSSSNHIKTMASPNFKMCFNKNQMSIDGNCSCKKNQSCGIFDPKLDSKHLKTMTKFDGLKDALSVVDHISKGKKSPSHYSYNELKDIARRSKKEATKIEKKIMKGFPAKEQNIYKKAKIIFANIVKNININNNSLPPFPVLDALYLLLDDKRKNKLKGAFHERKIIEKKVEEKVLRNDILYGTDQNISYVKNSALMDNSGHIENEENLNQYIEGGKSIITNTKLDIFRLMSKRYYEIYLKNDLYEEFLDF